MVGVLAVELFETVDGALVVNELAMRPHNSGHWTMDGAGTSQFEQHLRAVLDYPLGDTGPIAPVTVMANVLGAAEQTRRWAWTNGCTICSAGSPTPRCTCTARRSGRAARSATSTSSARGRLDDDSSTWRSFVNGPTGRHTGCRHAQWTDGWDGT